MFSKLFAHLRRQWMGALALFLALTGGTAYAATALDGPLPGTDQVGSLDIINSQVLSQDIANGQVRTADLARPAQLTLPSLQSCATGKNWTSDAFNPIGFMRDRDGIVHLQGEALCDSGNTNSNDDIFKLPPGYWPSQDSNTFLRFVVRADAAAGGAFPDTLTVVGGGGFTAPDAPAARISLDGVSFRCGPSGVDGCP